MAIEEARRSAIALQARELTELRDLKERCARLEAERTRLKAIVQGSRDAIWAWTMDGAITLWNAAAEQLLGYAAEEIIGQSLMKLVRPERWSAAREVMANIKNGAWYGQHETSRVRKDGSLVDVELTVSPIFDSGGAVIGASTLCREITERKHFQASLSKRVSELTSLFHLTERLQRAERLDDIFAAALDAIEDALACSRASILLFDAGGAMRFVAWRGLSEAYRKAVDGHSPWARDVRDPSPILVADIEASAEPEPLKAVIRAEGIRGLAFIPLVVEGDLIGKFMTYYSRPHAFAEDEAKLAATIARQLALAVAHQLAAQELRQSEERFRLAVEAAPSGMAMTDSHGRIVMTNRQLEHLFGYGRGELVGQKIELLVPDASKARHPGLRRDYSSRPAARAMGLGRDLRALRKDGHEFPVEIGLSPFRTSQGLMTLAAVVDISSRKRAEAERELLIAELNHRVKNTLSIVQSIAHQTFREEVAAHDARNAFEGRLVALALAHNLLTQANWGLASLEKIARVVLNVGGESGGRILLSGPPILLPPKEALSIAMALHELCTNAMKYGALSNDAGRVAVQWSRAARPEPRLELVWREVGGPPVLPPRRRGFGSRMLERALADDLNGEVSVAYEPAGVVCRITASLPKTEDSIQ
ncbi:MAG: PAS domain S-box protein [Hyphomicrobiales bacterium]|nr:PAS domain S-box protein [Hyphomicrobiales bacterium]